MRKKYITPPVLYPTQNKIEFVLIKRDQLINKTLELLHIHIASYVMSTFL